MMAESDTTSLAASRMNGAKSPRISFSSDTEGLLEARGRAGSGIRGSDDEVWFTFFRLQLQSSAEDFRSAYPMSETFGSRFHDVDFVQELEEIARENRRSLLIHRKYHSGLTAEEASELDRLQAQSEAALAAELELPLASLRALADEQ